MLLNGYTSTTPQSLLKRMRLLRDAIYREGRELYQTWRPLIRRRAFCISALNLAYYLAFRQRDLRSLQTALMPYGLSSLGRSEARVLENLDAVIATLEAVCQDGSARHPRLQSFFRGARMLNRHTDVVFGPPPDNRSVRIMVTLPSEAAEDYDLVRHLLTNGMDCVRINCAHDTPEAWSAMIEHLRRAQLEVGRPCKVHMDLGGPKARTGRIVSKDEAADEARVFADDTLLLTRDEPQPSDEFPLQVQCLLPEALDQVKVGHAIWFDDGKIGATVEAQHPLGLVLRITTAQDKGEKLREEKGINFPDTDLNLNPLTDDDLEALDFIAANADMVGYSFVQDVSDIERLQRELSYRMSDPNRMTIIAKIETPRAVRNLPDLIVYAGGRQPFGVMIARGDLAVELGFERMAEIQEEILWLCEAAHVPVIWATQVLERFVKKGTPSRSEMTDAAMAVRAECVMLNKGPYIAEGVSILDDVLIRMQSHQTKKTPTLRALRSWSDFISPNEE